MKVVPIVGSVIANAVVLFALRVASKAREPHLPEAVTWISVVEAEQASPAAMPALTVKSASPAVSTPITRPAARTTLPHRTGSARGASARLAAAQPPVKLVVPESPPPQQQHQVEVAAAEPAIPRFDAPGMQLLPHQMASIVPDYDWAWGDTGTVRMRIGVRSTGEVSGVTFLVPSGSQALNTALEAAIRARPFAPCVWESGEATECTVDYRFDYAVTRFANGVREARTCGHIEDNQPSCCDAFER